MTPTLAEAVTLAREADVAIVVTRTFESEKMDRPDLRLPNWQGELIRAVSVVNPNTVVVLMNGGPVETASWEADVPAILEAWYAGQEQGNAVARILFGEVNSAGKLPVTFPRSYKEIPAATPAQYSGVNGIVQYSEGLFVGYRGYDQFEIEPHYPFGHGLSYTRFAYDQLSITLETHHDIQTILINFTLTNTGDRTGTEIAQLYLGMPDEVQAPPKKLVGWVRETLDPGKSREITVSLDPLSWERPLSFWNSQHRQWEITPGTYRVFVGASSRDIRLSGSFQFPPDK